jgi:hypothetical protein
LSVESQIPDILDDQLDDTGLRPDQIDGLEEFIADLIPDVDVSDIEISWDQVKNRPNIPSGGAIQSLKFLNDVDTSQLDKDPEGRFVLGSGSGGGDWVNEEPSGAVDGSNQTYTLSETPADGTLTLFVNGQYQRKGEEYSLSGDTISMTYAPPSGNLYAKYQKT